MRTSDKGLLEICEHEGIVPAPYRDSTGVWTYGVGHTAMAGGLDPQEMNGAMPQAFDVPKAVDRALALFREDVVKYENRVKKAIAGAPRMPNQFQFDALVSWDFNTGGATWRSKSGQPCQLIQQILRGDLSGDGFMGWLKPPEIRKRRRAEQRLFLTGNYDANGDDIPIWKTDGRGNLAGVLQSMDGAEVLARMRKGQPVMHADPAEQPRGFLALILALLRAFGGKRP